VCCHLSALENALVYKRHFTNVQVYFLWPPYVTGQAIMFLPCGFFLFYLLSSIFCLLFSRLISAVADWMSTIGLLLHMVWPSANLECGSEMCCTRLAGNAGPKKSPKIRHLGTIAQLCRTIYSQLRHIWMIGKKVLNSNVSPTCPHNMVNFGPLAAEICWRVWGTPAHFNGFRVLTVLLHGNLVVGVSQTL